MISGLQLQNKIIELEARVAMLETKQEILLETTTKLKEERNKNGKL